MSKDLSKIQKHFPGQVHRGKDIAKSELNKLFLYNKKIDALLYAYLQDLSVPVEVGKDEVTGKKINQTRVWKQVLPKQEQICKKVRIGSRVTLRTRLNTLIENGFVKEYDEYYLLLNPEKQFFPIPLETLKFLIDACSSDTIKIYIYLGQGYQMKKKQGRKYIFTKEQLIEAIGIPKTKGRQYEKIDNILDCLINNELIKVEVVPNGKVRRLKVSEFNYHYKKN